MAFLEEAIKGLVDLGLLDVVLPFVLVFAVVYGVLERTRALGSENGEPRRDLNAMFAFLLGFLAVASLRIVLATQTFAIVVSLAAVVALGFLLLAGLVGGGLNNRLVVAIGVVLCIVGVYFILDMIGILEMVDNRIVLAVLALLGIVWWMASGKETPDKKPGEKPKKNEGSETESGVGSGKKYTKEDLSGKGDLGVKWKG